jgi:hypothetical protein
MVHSFFQATKYVFDRLGQQATFVSLARHMYRTLTFRQETDLKLNMIISND